MKVVAPSAEQTGEYGTKSHLQFELQVETELLLKIQYFIVIPIESIILTLKNTHVEVELITILLSFAGHPRNTKSTIHTTDKKPINAFQAPNVL